MPVTPADLARTMVRRATARRDADELDRETCHREVVLALPACRAELGFGRAWLIGSLAWGGFGVRSDIDVVVEGASVAAVNALADRLGKVTDQSVDVLALEALPPSFRQRVLEDGVHVA